MSIKRRKKKKQPQRKKNNSPIKNTVLRKNYLKIIEKLCSKVSCLDAFGKLNKDEMILIFARRVYVEPVEFDKEVSYDLITYRFFKTYVRNFYHKPGFGVPNKDAKEFTNYEFLVGIQFLHTINEFEFERRQYFLIAFTPLRQLLGNRNEFIKHVTLLYCLLNNETNVYEGNMYALRLNTAIKHYPTPGFCYMNQMQSYLPRVSEFVNKGAKRKVYQLGYVNSEASINWFFISAKLLNGIYTGKKKDLPVCIQNHAYNRLFERLKPMPNNIIAWHLSYSIRTFKQVEIYKGRILIPIKIWSHKCGYFIASINKNRLILRTFLFLTHHYTPEGEKLEEISGLSKEEISYWKVDNLQNFMDSDLEKDHYMRQVLEQAGVGHLFEIDSDFITKKEEHLPYDWDALNLYIERGKEEVHDVVDDRYNEECMEDLLCEISEPDQE
ncbi:hypothetical protein [Marinifilum sp.]|uniref:hypothetical protein n=1 Tax=Marinifilum sp. TaxID=2033137 RepID=UPI003BA875A4